MDEQNIYGIKYEVDIEDLKMSMNEARSQIKKANSEFNKASSTMDDWSTSVDGINAKIKQLNSILDAERSKLANQQKKYNDVIDSIDRYGKEIDELNAQKQEAIQMYGKESSEVQSLEAQIAKLERQQSMAVTSADKLKIAINNQEATVNRTEKSIDSYAQQLEEVKTAQANAEKSGNSLETELKALRSASDNVDKSIENTGDGFTVFKGIVANLASSAVQSGISGLKNLASNVWNLTDATKEYNTMQAKLSGSAKNFGYDLEYAKDKYAELYTYVSDDQMATNAITNLMGLRVETGTLDNLVDGAIATWTAYGDSIPIESLTESMNETIQVAKVTGTFADTLNWASLNSQQWSNVLGQGTGAQSAFNKAIAEGLPVEDAFNSALQATSSQQERANIVARLLNETYGESKSTYDDLNGSILDANEAELKLKDTQADLAKSIQPIKTQFVELQNKGLKAMSPVIKEVAGGFNDLIEDIDWDGASDSIGDVLDTAGDGLKFVLDNIDPLKAGVTGLAVAWGTYKTAQLASNGATTLFTAIQKISTASTNTATASTVANTVATNANTVATKALSIAQMATPWGLIAGLIGGVVIGLGAYAVSQITAREETNKNTIATDELKESYKELNDELNTNKQAREDSIESIETEQAGLGIIAERLEDLAGKENKSNSEKQLMKHYVDELNEAMPNLNLQYDEEADKLNKSTEAIRTNIEASKDLALAKASQENLTKIAQDMATAEMGLADATKQHEENTKALAEAEADAEEKRKAWIEAGSDLYSEEYSAYTKAQSAQLEASENFQESKKVVEDYTDEIKDLNKEYENTEKYAKEKLDSADLEKALGDLVEQARQKGIEVPQAVSDGIRDGSYALPASVEEMQALVTYDSLAQKTKDAGHEVPKSIADGIKSGELQPSQAIAHMERLVNFNDLLDKSESAGRDVPQYIQDGILNGSLKPEEAVQYMNDLVTYDDLVAKAKKAGIDVPENIKQQIQSGQMKPKDAVQYMKDLINYNDMLSKAKSAGVTVPDNIKQGVASGQMKPKEAVDQINNLMVQEANSSAGEMNQAGSKAGSQYATGVGSKAGEANKQAKNVATNAKSGAESVSAYGSGQNFTQGFINGMGSLVTSVISTAGIIARNALNTIRSVGGEGSPWKTTTNSGEWLVEGFANGIRNKTKEAVKNAEKMTNAVLGAVDDSNMNDLLQINSIKTGIGSSARRISPVKSMQLATQTAGTGNVNNVVFNQYNESPKALDSLQIYRQTQKQLRQLKKWNGGSN